MEQKNTTLTNACSFVGVKPIMMELPYPPIQVKEKNLSYANLLGNDYCGAVSEMSAIAQYINNENRLACEDCPLARTILGIAMGEMMHMQMLGELIYLLGGQITFSFRGRDGKDRMWTPKYLTLSENPRDVLIAGIESEKEAIKQYKMHMNMIQDRYINAVLARIIKDEEYHIMILKALMNDY